MEAGRRRGEEGVGKVIGEGEGGEGCQQFLLPLPPAKPDMT